MYIHVDKVSVVRLADTNTNQEFQKLEVTLWKDYGRRPTATLGFITVPKALNIKTLENILNESLD